MDKYLGSVNVDTDLERGRYLYAERFCSDASLCVFLFS